MISHEEVYQIFKTYGIELNTQQIEEVIAFLELMADIVVDGELMAKLGYEV